MFDETGGDILPMCRQPCGCPIYDLARDSAVNIFIERYRLARTIYDLNEIPELLLRELHDLELDVDTSFLLRLEYIYASARANNNKGKLK